MKKLTIEERTKIREVSKGINNFISQTYETSQVWQNNLKEEFPKRIPFTHFTAKESYCQFFKDKKNPVLYLSGKSAEYSPQNILDILRQYLGNREGINALNKTPTLETLDNHLLFVRDIYPFRFHHIMDEHTRSRARYFPRVGPSFYAIEIAMTAENFDQALKSGQLNLIRKKVTGVIEDLQGLDIDEKIIATCYVENNVKFNFRKRYELGYIRYDAQVVNGQINYDKNKPLLVPNLNVLPSLEERNSSLPALCRPELHL